MPEIRVEATPKHVRALKAGQTIVDSRDARLLYGAFRYPFYLFPPEDISGEILFEQGEIKAHKWLGTVRHCDLKLENRTLPGAIATFEGSDTGSADLTQLVGVRWASMDNWFEESEEVFIHPHDPYHRLDVLHSTRHIEVEIAGQLVADSRRPIMLLETGMPVRWYLPKEDLRLDLLQQSSTKTGCAYKGFANYYSAKVGDEIIPDVAWYYTAPLRDALPVASHVCFFSERFDTRVDGILQPKKETFWAKKPPTEGGADPIDG